MKKITRKPSEIVRDAKEAILRNLHTMETTLGWVDHDGYTTKELAETTTELLSYCDIGRIRDKLRDEFDRLEEHYRKFTDDEEMEIWL